jgi:hypothetical protein
LEVRIADLHAGMVDKDAFEREIQILLKESAPRRLHGKLTPGKRRSRRSELTREGWRVK